MEPGYKYRKLIIVSITLILLLSVVSATYLDEARILFNNYIRGKNYVLIKFNIKIPYINADWCTVSIRRIHGGLNGSILASHSETRPGSALVLKDLVNEAFPVYRVGKNGVRSPKPVYMEPQEYFVIVKCYSKEDNYIALKGSYVHTLEVFPEKPLWSVTIKLRENDLSLTHQSLGKAPAAFSSECKIGSNLCTAPTVIGYLHSLPGLDVRFKLYSYPEASAVYLSSYHLECIKYDPEKCGCLEWGSWTESGKVRVASLVTQVTPNSISDGREGYAVGIVRYRQEYWPGWSNNRKTCSESPSWTIYPESIGALWPIVESKNTGQQIQSMKVPGYAYGPLKGSLEIMYNEYGASISDQKLGSLPTYITFRGARGFDTVTLPIYIYEAGRSDTQYITPSLLVNDTSGKNVPWFYWWFKNNNSMTQEVFFQGIDG